MRSSKVQHTFMLRRRAGPLEGEPGSVVGRPSAQKTPQVPYSYRWWYPAGIPMLARLPKNADANIGSCSMYERGSTPRRSPSRTAASAIRRTNPGNFIRSSSSLSTYLAPPKRSSWTRACMPETIASNDSSAGKLRLTTTNGAPSWSLRLTAYENQMSSRW